MSHANGQVRFADGLIMHFEYSGTVDVCISNLHDTYEQMIEHWRQQGWRECGCGLDEEVEIATDYGGGGWSPSGKACRHCRAITFDPYAARAMEDFDPSAIQEFSGLPEWWS